eukprot:15359454-Ditylum_brightwellii.AAC.1
MAEMNDSTNGGTVDDKRVKRPPDDHIALLDHNEMLWIKNGQDKNKEYNNEEDIYLFDCADLSTFESKLDTHFITYFKQQD